MPLTEIEDRVTALEHKAVEHDTRFANGREVMGGMKADIDSLKPKAPDWVKLGGVALSFVITLLAGHYWIVEQLNDRPTDVQIEKIMSAHAERGHAATDSEIREIREVQAEQKVILSAQADTLNKHGDKLDLILTRLPRRLKNADGD